MMPVVLPTLSRANLIRRSALRRFCAILTVVIVPVNTLAADHASDVKQTIERGLAFLAKDNLAWKVKRKCAECHHAPFTIWALNEGKKQGYAIDENALVEMTSWVLGKEYLGKLLARPPKQEQSVLNEAPLLLALGIEAGDTNVARDGLKQMLASVLRDQDRDGSWKLGIETGLPLAGASTAMLHGAPLGQGPLLSASALVPGRARSFRPIGPSPETLTTLALLALSASQAPEMGKQGEMAREKALNWLRTIKSDDDELQSAALRVVLWRRLGLPATEWEPLVKRICSSRNADGGWGQTRGAKSDAYATGQALYALAEAGMKPGDAMVRRAQTYLAKAQRPDGSWTMASRAILPSGTSSKNLEPITHAGSAWAVMGLARSSRR
jgi:hypothetical protein